MNETYLCHYGVQGMKWGQRKNRNYVYKSHATKKYTKKLAGAQKAGNVYKAAIYKNRLQRSQLLDKGEQRYANRVSAGGNIAARILTVGRVGGKPYQQWLAMQGRNGTANKLGAAALSVLLGGRFGSTAGKALWIRAGEEAIKNKYNK